MFRLLFVLVALLCALSIIFADSRTVQPVPFSNQVIAPPVVATIQPGASDILTLQYLYGKASDLEFYIVNSTGTGQLYQLAHNYIKQGYEPKNGQKINIGSMVLGDKKLPTSTLPSSSSSEQKAVMVAADALQRIFYVRPNPDRIPTNSKYGTIDYQIVRKTDKYQSEVGTIVLVSPSGALVGSDFSSVVASKAGNDIAIDGWKIVGNVNIVNSVSGDVQAVSVTNPTFERFRLGEMHNFYIVGTEDSFDIPSAESGDRQLWYFQAPPKFLGNQGIAYRGYLSFAITAISGDFQRMNDLSNLNFVELECDTCDGPVRKGIKLAYRLSSWPYPFTGPAQQIRLHLHEHGGWLQDSQDRNVAWKAPSACTMMQVLGRLSSVRILGDFTQGYETIALDDVRLTNQQMQIPPCAMYKPDLSICLCENE